VNICFICSEYPPALHGGIGSVTRVLGRALVERGHHVRVIGAYHASAQVPLYEEDSGVEVWRLKMPAAPRLGWIGARVSLYWKIATWAKRGQIDLVEVPDWEGWVAGWPSLPVPVIARLHGSSCYFAAELRDPFRKTTYWLERAALRRSDYWCSVSRYTADRTRRLFALENGPGTVIYNAVEVPSGSSPVLRSRGDVLFSGTLTEKKGIVPLIQAWPAVKNRRLDARLHVYGKDTSNPGKASMRDALIAQLPENVRDSVIFHGHTPRARVLTHLQQARVAVFPSLAEAFAMAPLEAMAQGCPTIYSTKGSGPEVIDDGKDGLLVDPENPRRIADSIVRLLEDDALALRLGSAGQEKIRRSFSTGKILQRNEDFYGECLERFRHASRN
jgi:glycosyltransferase involved in cell wall biosynthesis